MMVHYCDACGKEIDRPNRIGIPCHLYSLRGKPGYVDIDGHEVSGREDQVDLCNKCLNQSVSCMVDKIIEIQGWK